MVPRNQNHKSVEQSIFIYMNIEQSIDKIQPLGPLVVLPSRPRRPRLKIREIEADFDTMFQFSTRSEVRLARSPRPGIEQDSERVDASSKIAVVLSRGLHGGAPRPRVHRRLRPGDRPGLVKAPRGALVMLHTSHVTHCHTSH